MLFLRRRRDHGAGDRPSLGLVAVEQHLGVAGAVQGIGEFPAEIDRILDAGVHALPTGRRMDVGGVARQETAADPVMRRQPLVDAKDRQPARIVDVEAARAVAVDATLHLLEGRRLVAFRRVLAAHGEDAPDFLAEGKHRDGAAVVPPQIDAAMIEVAARDLHVGKQEGLRLGIALEDDLQRLTHGAARAVAAGQVFGPDALGGAVGMAQAGGDAGGIVGQSDQFDVALDGDSQCGSTARSAAPRCAIGATAAERETRYRCLRRRPASPACGRPRRRTAH